MLYIPQQVGKDSQLCAKESHFEIGCPLRGIGNRLVRADPLCSVYDANTTD